MLGEPKTTVHAVNDIASGKLSSTTASAPPKDSLADHKGQVSRPPRAYAPASLAPPPRGQCRLASHPAPLTSLGGGGDARRAGRRAFAGVHVHMHVHVSLLFSSISTTPRIRVHTHTLTALRPLAAPSAVIRPPSLRCWARPDLQRHRHFEALIDVRFGPPQERARRPRRPQGPGVANTPHTPKPHPNRTHVQPLHYPPPPPHSQRSHRRVSWARGPRSSSRPRRTPRKWRKPWGASAPQLVESGPSSQFWLAP